MVVDKCARLLVLLMLAGGCSEENPDPRALPQSDSELSLDEGLDDFDIWLPDSATDVRFGYFVGIQEDGFKLRFDFKCNEMKEFFRRSRFQAILEKGGEAPDLVETMMIQYDWEFSGTLIAVSDGVPGQIPYRDLAIEQAAQEKCVAYVSAFR